MPTDENAQGNSNAPEQPPTNPPRPLVEGNKNSESHPGENKRYPIQKTKYKPAHWVGYVESIFGLILIVITGYYTRAAFRQATASETAASAAKSAAETADATLKHITDNDKATRETNLSSFKQEQRAYVAYTYATMSNPPTCGVPGLAATRVCADIHVANSGRTPAVGLHLYRRATFGENAEKTIKAYPVPPRNFGPNGDLLGNVGDKWITAVTDPVDDDTRNKLVNATIELYVYGVVEYYDIFGDYHETGFCVHRVIGSSAFMECEYGNWFDQRPTYDKQKKKCCPVTAKLPITSMDGQLSPYPLPAPHAALSR